MKLKRKVLLILPLCVLVIGLLVVFNKKSDDINDGETKNYLSIFVNELPDFSHVEPKFVRVLDYDKFWIVDGKFYSVESTLQPHMSANVYWKIDLSKLNLCATCDNIKLYSSNGICDNDIIIAEKSGELFLLTCGEVLMPQKYSIEDFTVTYQSNENSDDYIAKVWADHLSGNYFLNAVAYDDMPEELCLSPKSNPELSYQIFYANISNNYFSKLPFGTTLEKWKEQK